MKRVLLILMGVIMMFGLSGCGAKKYRLTLDDYGFEKAKRSYKEGAQVMVYYNLIATDTDYSFYSEPEMEMKHSYDPDHGYVLEFTMPAHDVKLCVKTRNSMEYDPDAEND